MNENERNNSLRLQGHDYSQAGLYFITICTKNGEMLFGEVAGGSQAVGAAAHSRPQLTPTMVLNDYGAAVQSVIENTDKSYTNLKVESYVVMPNHVHLLIRVVESARAAVGSRPYNAAIPTYVRTLKTLVTKRIGFSPWQRSFFDRIIRSGDFEKIVHYIRNNPAAWEKDRFYCIPKPQTEG